MGEEIKFEKKLKLEKRIFDFNRSIFIFDDQLKKNVIWYFLE